MGCILTALVLTFGILGIAIPATAVIAQTSNRPVAIPDDVFRQILDAASWKHEDPVDKQAPGVIPSKRLTKNRVGCAMRLLAR